jgi:hypothetical protein
MRVIFWNQYTKVQYNITGTDMVLARTILTDSESGIPLAWHSDRDNRWHYHNPNAEGHFLTATHIYFEEE